MIDSCYDWNEIKPSTDPRFQVIVAFFTDVFFIFLNDQLNLGHLRSYDVEDELRTLNF